MKKIFEILSRIGKLWEDKVVLKLLRWSLVALVLQGLVIWWKFSQLPPKIPLFYSRAWGEEQLAEVHYIFGLPIMSLIVLVVNNFIASMMGEKEKTLVIVLSLSGLVFSFLALVTVFKIVSIVG
jgi:hypothetical protein